MMHCPKGAIVRHDEIETLLEALETAAEDLRCEIDSFLPPQRRKWNEADRQKFARWSNSIRRFERLRKDFRRVQASAPSAKSADRKT